MTTQSNPISTAIGASNSVPDPAKVEAFGGKLVGTLNDAALMMMISLGHRTGLFDAMSLMPSATSSQIAEQADLSERYVREWLGAMMTGGLIEHDPSAKTYRLPPEHAAMLTRAAAPNNSRSACCAVHLHDQHDALHERFTGQRRPRPWGGLGEGIGAGDARRRRLWQCSCRGAAA